MNEWATMVSGWDPRPALWHGPLLMLLAWLATQGGRRRGRWWLGPAVFAGGLLILSPHDEQGGWLLCWLTAFLLGGEAVFRPQANRLLLLGLLLVTLCERPTFTGDGAGRLLPAAMAYLTVAMAVDHRIRRPHWLRAFYLGVVSLGALACLTSGATFLATLLILPVLFVGDPDAGDESFGIEPYRYRAALPLLLALVAVQMNG